MIPLRRPYARFTAPGLALVGDAACQVFPAHGSGIGLGLIAGRLLADAVAGPAGAHDPGREQVLWDYQAAFQREFGGVLLSSDIFRRLSTAGLGAAGVRSLIAAGLMTEPMARSGLDQQWPEPDPAELASLAGRLTRAPGLARRMLPRLARGPAAGHLAASYPEQVDVAALTRVGPPGPAPARRAAAVTTARPGSGRPGQGAARIRERPGSGRDPGVGGQEGPHHLAGHRGPGTRGRSVAPTGPACPCPIQGRGWRRPPR